MNQPISNLSNPQSCSTEEIRFWLISQIAKQLNISPGAVDTQAPLDSFGLDSTQAMILISQAEKRLGCEVSPILLWHYPTIAALSQRLAEEAKTANSQVIEI